MERYPSTAQPRGPLVHAPSSRAVVGLMPVMQPGHLLLSLLLAAGQGKTSIALIMQLSKCSVHGSFLLGFRDSRSIAFRQCWDVRVN